MSPPWLEQPLLTDRLRLRQSTEADQPAKVDLLMDPKVREYVGGAKSTNEAHRLVHERGVDPTWGHFVIADEDSDGLAGTLSFDQKRGPWEVSFQLRRVLWGQGLMAEALRAARDWFFENSDCVEFIAVTQEANERTRRLLLRVGSVETRTFEQYGLPQVEYTVQPVTASEA